MVNKRVNNLPAFNSNQTFKRKDHVQKLFCSEKEKVILKVGSLYRIIAQYLVENNSLTFFHVGNSSFPLPPIP